MPNTKRYPVVAVMGHVDHGKTSFLDAVRGSRVADKEAGGITQNTRAHEVTTKSGFRITFIDTPGHEAFSKMRERGAKVTDFVLLIVAADDGVQPQTKESIKFAKQDNVPIIVAINKIDVKGVNLQKIKTELSSNGVNIEEYGGDVLCFEISAKEKKGLDELLEGIELLTEVTPMKENVPAYGATAEAFVLESNLDKRLGNVALCILKSGKLDSRLIGVDAKEIFKTRAYLDEFQKSKNVVEESEPFWVTGMNTTIGAGESIYFVEDDKKAKEIQSILDELNKKPVEEKTEDEAVDAESLFAQMLIKREEVKLGNDQKEINIIVKSSTEGTLEAILNKLNTMGNEEVKLRILTSGTGDVTEDEVRRAKIAGGIIVTFQLPVPTKIEALGRTEKVLIRNYEVVYEMFNELEDVLNSYGQPIEEEVEVARARIKQIFTLSDGTAIAGCVVEKGTIVKGYRVKVEREDRDDILELGRGKIISLRINKEEVKEVKKGLDCGIMIDARIEHMEEGDDIVAYKVEKY